MGSEQTYWNGEHADAERVTVIVADNTAHELYWARPFVGQERKAVAVTYEGYTFYLDDEGFSHSDEHIAEMAERFPGVHISKQVGFPGWGWEKVTKLGGSPKTGHAEMDIERVVGTRDE